MGTQPQLSLSAAARIAGVSVVTLRKHLNSGVLKAKKATGPHGDTWQIAPDALAAFVADRYGREIDVPLSFGPDGSLTGIHTDTPAALRRQLDDALLELGKYRALTAKAESANADVERLLKERIAEVQAERDAARAEADRLKTRGFWGRVFGAK